MVSNLLLRNSFKLKGKLLEGKTLKQLAGHLTHLSDELEESLNNDTIYFEQKKGHQKAASHSIFDMVNTSVDLKSLKNIVDPKYLGVENSRMKLATRGSSSIREIFSSLRTAYQDNSNSKSLSSGFSAIHFFMVS